MNYDEIIKSLTECVEDTDKLPATVNDIIDGLKEQQTTFEALNNHIKELEQTNNKLREDNYKAVLQRLHTEQNNEVVEETTRAQRVEEYARRLRGE